MGRFLSPDPVVQSPGYSQSYNRYSYCFNNPLKYSDPSGFTVQDIIDDLMGSPHGGTWSLGTGTYYFHSDAEANDFATGRNHNPGSSSKKTNHKSSKNNQQNQITFNNLLADFKEVLLGQGGMMFYGTLEDVLESNLDFDPYSTPWMDFAIVELDKKIEEWGELGDNPRIIEYLKAAGLSGGYLKDETGWCASFVHWCLKQAKIDGAGARCSNWKSWGQALDEPMYGAIAVFTGSHVGFVLGMNGDNLVILHGNWSGKLTKTEVDPSSISGYRYPSDYLPSPLNP
jgi:uncharacterized protein (TIGR02594 family)